ncbi:MAG: hypothetical protein H8E38_02700 [SAR324 cluster bacterium]|nr:hypothetical protein [SAR324 cluster bacterium]MBL7035824.1 hypothetical protein [SAR324 cluster bacterium]
MTLLNTLRHILQHYSRVFINLFSYKLPHELQKYRTDCENLVGRYNTLLKEISEYMKEHSKMQEDDSENSDLTLSYTDTDSFFLISIKEDLEILTVDCEELLEKGVQQPSEIHLHNETIKQYLNQLQELRSYSEQIESALHEYEENIMKIEEEISNNTLCN